MLKIAKLIFGELKQCKNICCQNLSVI